MINPKPEHRLTFLEKQFIAMGGHLEGIQEDIENLDQGMRSSFAQIGDTFIAVETTIRDDINKLEEHLDSTMVTKDELRNELSAMETRLIDAMKMLFQQKSSE